MHIFISYQWDDQQVVKKLSDSLKDAGYQVWVDLYQTDRPILEGMAEAVENAVVVIICVTEKYKESANCRTEAQYSHSLQKNIIPLLLQPRYKPDGWLGAITGKKVYYDFSNIAKYDSSLKDLTKELGDRGKAFSADVADSLEVATPSKTNVLYSEIPSSVSNVGTRSADDVKRWLEDNGMENFQDWKQQPDNISKNETEMSKKSEADGKAQTEKTTVKKSNEPQTFFQKLGKNVSVKMNSALDHMTNGYLNQLISLRDHSSCETPEERNKVADQLTLLGVLELFQKIWEKYFEMDFLNKDNKIIGKVMTKILGLMSFCTEASLASCEKVYRTGLYDPILSYLDSSYLDPSNPSNMGKLDFKEIVCGLMGILYNMLQKITASREAISGKKSIDVLQRFRSSSNEMIACKALITQAYVMTEEDNERVNSDETSFQIWKKILDDALQHPDHCAKAYGVSAIEAIAALNLLATIGNNQVRIVSAKLLQLYVKMLQPECPTAEQAAAAEGIWTMTFKCNTNLENEPGCKQALQNLVTTSSDRVVVNQAKRALRMLERDKNDSPAAKEISRSSSLAGAGGSGGGGHIFISYQWDNQEVIKKLADGLKSAGYNVWVDLEKMSEAGSLLDGMAEAVENAEVVIMCVSEKYKKSTNCKLEADYSFRLHKDIIPLRLQPKYNPDKWLGILQGAKLYHDFSSEDKYDRSFNELIKALGNKGKATLAGTDIPDGLEVATPSKAKVLHSEIPRSVSNFGNWSTDDVKIWLKDSGMENLQDRLHEVDGRLLKQYRSMRQSAPETFYSMLKENGFSLHDIFRLCEALDQL